ncbi:hypothetical protein Esti_001394 [Eimeria stiedai]
MIPCVNTIWLAGLLEEMVRQVAGPGNYISMVVDDKTLRVLSSCCSVYDVLYDGVTVIELLSKQRQPLPELNALYFLSPSEDSIRALIDDFKDERKPQYRSAYVYLSSNIPESSKIMTRLADSPTLLPRIRCLVEFNLSFIAYEQRIFHFGMSNALLRLFPLPPPYLLQKIADDLISLCATIGQKPSVRFQKNQLPWCEQLATLVHSGLQSMDLPATDQAGATLLILDRSVDLAPLFVHEYTYQALAYDILDLPVCCSTDGKKSGDGSSVIEDVYEYHTGASRMSFCYLGQAILGEQDEVWIRYRHQHIQEVNQSVQEEVQLFIKENSTAKVQQNIATSSEDTLRAIRSLPQYQEALARYWTHVTLSEKCFDRLQELQIMTLGALEQDICCGVDKDGKEVNASKLQASVASLVSDSSIGQDEKLRLLLLFFTQTQGLDAADRVKAMEAAQMSLVNQRCIQQFLERRFAARAEMQQRRAHASSGRQPCKSKLAHRLEDDRDRIKYFKQRAKRARYDLSRFEPTIHEIMEKAIQGTLHGGRYPFVDEPSFRVCNCYAASVIGRSTEWTWDSATDSVQKVKGTEHCKYSTWVHLLPSSNICALCFSQSVPQIVDRSKKRLVVFVLGGIVQSEMRCAYEVSKELNCEVFLGGTNIFTPTQVIRQLKDQAPLS